jgi:predicted acetyltransferase
VSDHPAYPIRPVDAGELARFFTVMESAFGEDFPESELAAATLTAEADRTLAGFDGDDIVGTAGAFTFDLSVPGARVPAAGVTYVSVRTTHRRRGLLSAMMRRQLEDVHERGEPVAVLWASEAAIYGRFGYGVASRLLRIEVDRVDASLRADVPDDRDLRLRLVAADDARPEIERVEQMSLDARPGQFSRDKRWIEQLVHDPDSRRGGMSKLQCLTVRDRDDVVGYALYRTKPESLRPHMLPNGNLLVQAQAALTPAANVALTRTLLATDLMRRVTWWNRPVDTPLPHLLQDPRHARTTLVDGLHLRVVDVAAALGARRYAAPVDVVLDVSDRLCPWNQGRWHLRADPSGAECRPTDAAAQVRLDIEALGAAYLGGTSLATLAAAGRVTTTDAGTLARASVGFGWHVAPWCPVIF